MVEFPETTLDLRAGLASGAFSALDLARTLCDRNRRLDPDIRAWAHFDEAAFLAAADRPGPGALAGLPVAVKDILDTFDMPTERGSPLCAGRRPTRDAAAVAAIRAAGGIVMGKSVTTEFAYAHPGPTRNPHNPDHTPGGSSSGSAAAVAAGIVPLAVGTQTAGSIIRPAAFCGVVGFKPSFGRIDRSGVLSFSASLDTIGAFARDVAGAWLLAEVMAGETEPEVPAPSRPRIGLCRTSDWSAAEPASQAAVLEAADRLAAAGATVAEAPLPAECGDLARVQLDIMAHEAARAFADEARLHPDRLSDELRAFLAIGDPITLGAYRRRIEEADLARRVFGGVFDQYDILLTPSAVGEAPRGLASTGDAILNRVWTLLGGPCLHLPTGLGPAGLPVGVQLVGRPGDDARLAAAALWVEAVLAGGA